MVATHKGRREARIPQRMDLPDALANAIRQMISEMVREFVPIGGTVVGREGGGGNGNVRVQLDDEEGDIRTFPRQRGVDHRPGDRVQVSKNRSGEEILTSNISAGPDEQAVGNAQLFTDAADSRVIKSNAVTNDHIAADAVEEGNIKAKAIKSTHVDSGAIKNEHVGDNAVDRRNIARAEVLDEHLSGGISKNKLEGPVQTSLNRADTALQSRDLRGYARESQIPNTSDFLKSGDLDPVKKDITELQRQMKRCKCE